VHVHADVFLRALTGLWERFSSFQTQHKRAHDHQRMFRILITMAATERNIRLIAETIITSHTGTAYNVEHNAQGTPPHHGFSLLVSVECACVEHRRSQGVKGAMPPQILGKYSHFLLWEAFFQTKQCYSPKIKHFGLPKYFGLAVPLV